ncbi:MAG: calcium-binding protein, partial [Brevundimonas sp.]
GVDADTIVAGAGVDRITVLGGADTVASGAGNDTLVVDYSARVTNVIGGVTGGNLLTGYTGNISDGTVHTVDFNTTENFIVTTGSGDDAITTGDGVDILSGGTGDDVLDGGGGKDVLKGGGGDDTLMGGGGADTLSGGGGVDTADYSGAAGGVRADLLAGVASNDGDGSADVLSLIEDLIGSAFDDVLAGGNGANALTGGDGRDVLKGQGGDDVLTGGRGDDTLSGGGGANDVAVMSGVQSDYTVTAQGAAGSYRITDGVAGRDGVDSLSLVEWVRFSDGSTVRVSDMVAAAPLAPEAKSAAAFVMPGLEDDAFLVGKADLSGPFVLPTDASDPFLVALGETPGFQAAAGNWMANLVDSGEPASRPMDDDAWLGRPGEDLWQ